MHEEQHHINSGIRHFQIKSCDFRNILCLIVHKTLINKLFFLKSLQQFNKSKECFNIILQPRSPSLSQTDAVYIKYIIKIINELIN